MTSSLPPLHPSVEGLRQEEAAYLKTLRGEGASAVVMRDDLLAQGGPLHPLVVAIPLLTTQDLDYLPSLLEEYRQQEYGAFTLVIYPNASRTADPEQTSVETCRRLVLSYKALHPTFDLRVVVNPSPPASNPGIGAVRKVLWDAIVLAGESSGFSRLTEALTAEMGALRGMVDTLQEPLNILDPLPREHRTSLLELLLWSAAYERGWGYICNHDADLLKMPKAFMGSLALSLMRDLHLLPHPSFYGTTMVHGREAERPHLSQATAVFDMYHRQARGSYEASLVIPTLLYSAFGGFQAGAHTYEVAGLVHRREGYAPHHLRLPALVTSPRRFVEGLQEGTISTLWGPPRAGTEEDFSEADACRGDLSSRGDLSQERRDALLREYLTPRPLAAALLTATCDAPEEAGFLLEAHRLLQEASTRQEAEEAYLLLTSRLEAGALRRGRGFFRLLRSLGYAHAEEEALKFLRDLSLERGLQRRVLEEEQELLRPAEAPPRASSAFVDLSSLEASLPSSSQGSPQGA